MNENLQGQSNQIKVNLQENENSNNKKLAYKEGKQKHKTNVGLNEDADNIVDFTDTSTTKKLSTVGSNISVSSNLQNKQNKKKNDFISLRLTVSEDDYSDVNEDSKCVKMCIRDRSYAYLGNN